MLKSIAADLSGAADVCYPVRDLSKAFAVDYVVPGETLMFVLQSAKEEFAFTNQAMITCVGASATTTRKLMTRYDYKSNVINHALFETAGHVDRDCEIKFQIGEHPVSIDVAKDETDISRVYYKVIELLGRAQRDNARNWEFALASMGHASNALRVREASGQTLTRQSDEALAWMQTLYHKYNPRCYREVIEAAFQAVQSPGKKVEP